MPKLYGQKPDAPSHNVSQQASRNSVMIQTDNSRTSITKIVISRKERDRRKHAQESDETEIGDWQKRSRQNHKVFENALRLKQPFKHLQD